MRRVRWDVKDDSRRAVAFYAKFKSMMFACERMLLGVSDQQWH